MTTHKGFKRLVRSRMAKTGERYAAARRAIGAAARPADRGNAETAGYRYRGGLHPDTACVANVLANGGMTSPLTGGPLSEALILVVGGGLGAGYILWEFEGREPILTLGFRNRWQYPAVPGWLGNVLDRLGIDRRVHETAGPKTAATTLDDLLANGDRVIAFVDQQEIGTWGQPDRFSGERGYPVVVAGRAPNGDYLVDDRGREALHVAQDTLVRARGRIGSWRHRLIELHPEPGEMPVARLRAALQAGLEDQVEHLRSPSDSFSLPAWRKWSRLMTDTRNRKAWPRVFAGGAGLSGALLSIAEGVDGDIGAEGGHLRDLFADGLDEAAIVLEVPALGDAASAWREAADLWQDLADAAAPPELDGAAEAIEAAEDLHEAVMAGEPGRRRAGAAAARLWALRDRPPVPSEPAIVEALLADLGARLAAIHAAEVRALDATAGAIGR